MPPVVQICPPAPQDVFFDEHAFQRPRRAYQMVSADSHISFEDSRHMHLYRRREAHIPHGLRRPAPAWAVNDESLRELLLVSLERRFAVIPPADADTDTRLARIEAKAQSLVGAQRANLKRHLRRYQEPRDARGRFSTKKQAGVHLQNEDTRIVMTQRGVAVIMAAIVYLYHRLGYTSVDCAEALRLKPPHCRQILFRLDKTWKRFFVAGNNPRTQVRGRLASRTRYVAGVGEKYEVRRRLRRVQKPLKLGNRKP